MRKYLTICFIFIFGMTAFSQSSFVSDCKDTIEYHPNGKFWKKYKLCPEGIIDTMFVYKNNGNLEAYFIFGTRNSNQPIIRHLFFTSGATREIVSQYILNQDNMPIDVGATKYYRKDGTLMDSVIYENGKEIYRARFNKKGTLQFENKPK